MNEPLQISEQELERLHDEAFRWALSCCKYDSEKAKDVMQTCYLEILDGRASYNGKSSLRPWLFSVIRRLAWRQSRTLLSIDNLKTRFSRLEITKIEPSDPVAGLDSKRLRQTIRESIFALPLKQRQIVELVYYRGLTIAEAAIVIDVSIGSARTHLHRAKKTLEKKLMEFEA